MRDLLRIAAFMRGDRGQALVEFALIMPVLLLLILGLIDVARAVAQENTLAFAAREGTRYAIVHGADASPGLTLCGQVVYTTTTVSPGSRSVTVADALGVAQTSGAGFWSNSNFPAGTTILADSGGGTSNMETIVVTAVSSTTITATFGKSHSGTWAITGACSDSSMSSVVQAAAIGVPNVTTTIGYPDASTIRGSRVFVDATAPFVPLPSQYLLNGALTITLRGGSMLVIQY
jgi:Flp pilus assembly protein TadG